MATAATTYFGNRARAAITLPTVAPALADLVTVTRGFEATFSWENADLYGTDSIFRVDEAKHTSKNQAKLKACKFEPTTATGVGLMKHILNALNGAAGGTGAIAETNNQYLMDVYIWQPGTNTPLTNLYCLKIENAYMEQVPMVFPENDYVTVDLSFWGRTGAISQTAIPVA
jgi:hypothetical protein